MGKIAENMGERRPIMENFLKKYGGCILYAMIHLILLSVFIVYVGENGLLGKEKLTFLEYVYRYGNGILLILLLALLGAGCTFLGLKEQKKEQIMIFLLLGLEILYFWAMPIGAVADEPNHFFRAYEISCGHMVSKHMGGIQLGGNYLPEGLAYFTDKSVQLDKDNLTAYYFGNTALYAPVSYLPQAAGILLTRFFTDNVYTIFYGGRFGGALINFLLCIWALKKMPFAKELLFLIMVFPVSIQEMISMAADGFTLSLSLAFLAYVLSLAYGNKKIEKRSIVLLTGMALCLSLCKIIYMVLVFLIFLIPKEKFVKKDKIRFIQAGIIATAVVVNLSWLYISSGFLLEFTPGVDSGAQVKYVITHPLDYYATIIRTVLNDFQGWIQTMFGSNLGSLNIAVSSVMWITFLCMVFHETHRCTFGEVDIKVSDIACFLMVVFAGGLLVCTSLYVQWTAYMGTMISGIQGRYFLPFLPLLLLGFAYNNHMQCPESKHNQRIKNNGKYMFLLILFCNAIALVDVVEFKMLG